MGEAKLDSLGEKSIKGLILKRIFPENSDWNGPISGLF
jgi:hypothetical protein